MITLGTDTATTVASVRTARVGSFAIYVADTRWLRAFDRQGNPRFGIPLGAGGSGRMPTPIGLAVADDSLLALSIDPANGIAVLDDVGNIRRRIPVSVSAATVDIARDGRLLAIATVTADLTTKSPVDIVRIIDDTGRASGAGCRPSPRIAQGQKRGSLAAMFRGVGVSISAGRIYCQQAITPVVQVLDATGRLVDVVRLAPPFYRPPPDGRESMNQLTIDRFRSTWWEHRRFYAFRQGFASVYESYDTTSKKERYRLFRCDSSAAQRRCLVASLPGAPVDFLGPDTIVVEEPRRSSTLPQRLMLLVVPPRLN